MANNKHFRLKLSANVRLRMIFADEMARDPDQAVFNDDLHTKYLGVRTAALEKQEGMLRALFIADGLLALLIFGKNFTIPGTSIAVQDLPAAREVLTVISSIAYLFTCLAFVNVQAYQAIIDQFNNRIAAKVGTDPDFVGAADGVNELYFKMFRPRFSLHKKDMFQPGWAFTAFYGMLMKLIMTALAGIILLHFVLVFYAAWHAYDGTLLSLAVPLIAVVTNTAGFLTTLMPALSFTIHPPNVDKAE